MKKALALTMTAAMAATMLAGCGSSAASSSTAASTAESTSTAASEAATDSDKPYEGVTLHYAATDTEAAGAEMQDIVKMVKEKTGINIEFTIIPKADTGEVDKRLVSLQAGDELDLIYGTTAQLKVFYDAGVLTPVDELATNAGYDMKGVFGDSLPVYSDGQTYGLPAFNDVWCTFINNKVFEEAGVEVPSADGWTWEKYIETAQKLTDADNNVFGSLMLDYDCYNYMYALQNGAEHYKEDGTSNYDDSRFKDSVEFFYSLGNDLKIQPDITSYKAGGHNGLKSIIASLDTENFNRIRIGIGAKPNPQYDLAAWVLGKLPPADRKAMTDRYPDIEDACKLLMDGNLQYAQNKFNH